MESGCRGLIGKAFDALRERPGFVERPDQLQLALLIGDCIESGSSGAFEAPTGLGKSLAALVPALARAAVHGGRTVVATYTNVLAEQYWKSDLPLARSLLPEFDVPVAFLIGRQRYVCLSALKAADLKLAEAFVRLADQGTEAELRGSGLGRQRQLAELWRGVGVPPACKARRCPDYASCWFFGARERAKESKVVVTNHSVLLMDALLRRNSEGTQSLLGDDYSLIVDEAHDFAQAAASALEFELSSARLELMERCAAGLGEALAVVAMASGEVAALEAAGERFLERTDRLRAKLRSLAGRSGILAANPRDILEHPRVSHAVSAELRGAAEEIADEAAEAIEEFVRETGRLLRSWRLRGEAEKVDLDEAEEVADPYRMVLRETAAGCRSLFEPSGAAVSYVTSDAESAALRSDPIDLVEPLRDLLWSRRSAVCLSATLALDGHFGFFRAQTGFEPDFEEVLPSPFDFESQAALYLPPEGAIPDPSVARRSGGEEAYYDAVAAELSRILVAVRGRTLALFHSRREMESVYDRMRVPPELPVLLQGRSGASIVGERFRENVAASLFALRSFWTGFDAPGETLSCVALVRVPFEVPVDPAQIARGAWLSVRGLDPFHEHSLPLAKMLARQGAGRLIRRASDRGVIALLDPRVQTKRYGQEILENLPPNLRVFRDVEEAAAHVGLHA